MLSSSPIPFQSSEFRVYGLQLKALIGGLRVECAEGARKAGDDPDAGDLQRASARPVRQDLAQRRPQGRFTPTPHTPRYRTMSVAFSPHLCFLVRRKFPVSLSGVAYRRAYGLSTSGLIKKSLGPCEMHREPPGEEAGGHTRH